MTKKTDEVEKVEEPKTVPVLFVWNILRPDVRQYKQQSIEIVPYVSVALDIPKEFIVEVVENQTVLTLQGMKYVQDQFEKLYPDVSVESASKASDGDWEEDNKKPAFKASTEDDDWGDELDDVEEDESKEKPSPDKEEDKPDTEKWEEDEEDW